MLKYLEREKIRVGNHWVSLEQLADAMMWNNLQINDKIAKEIYGNEYEKLVSDCNIEYEVKGEQNVSE